MKYNTNLSTNSFFSPSGWETIIAPQSKYENIFSSNETNLQTTYYLNILGLFAKCTTMLKICLQIFSLLLQVKKTYSEQNQIGSLEKALSNHI